MRKIEGKPTSGKRDEMINWRIANMAEFARDLISIGWDRCQEAQKDVYIRIRGESMQAVSLKDDSALNGCGKAQTCASKIESEARKTPKRLGEGTTRREEDVFNAKKERRLQAYIVKKSLEDKGSLLGATLFKCLDSIFDELLLVTDEISFGDSNHENENELPEELRRRNRTYRPDIVRCDIFAVGKIGDEIHPVLIELKSERSLSRLFEQLDNASFDIGDSRNPKKDERRIGIANLVKETTGMEISSFDVKKVLVWPVPKTGDSSSTDTTNRIASSKVICIDYFEQDFESPSDVKFKMNDACSKSL